jgi:hypothetical protein
MRLLLWKLKGYYHVRRIPPLDPTVSHLDGVSAHIIFFKYIVILSASYLGVFVLKCMYLSLPVLAICPAPPRPAHPIFLDFIYSSSVTLYSSDFLDFSSTYTVPLTRHTVVLVDCICSGLCP